MTLLKETLGLACVITLAIYVNRVLMFYGFKRDPNLTHREMAIDSLTCQLVNPLDEEEHWAYGEDGLRVKGMYVGEDLIFISHRDTIIMVDLTEDLSEYTLPLFEPTKMLQFEGDAEFGTIDGYQSKDGRLIIYVYNEATRSVEKFEYNSGLNVLTWQKSFTSESMHDVRGIHVIGEDNFYYTIHYYFPVDSWLRPVEEWSMLRLGAIGLCKSGVNAECKRITELELAAPSGLIGKKIFDEAKFVTRHFLYATQYASNEVAMYEIEFDYRLTYGKAIPASNQLKSFHVGYEDEVYAIGTPLIYTADGMSQGVESLKMNGLDEFEVFYLNVEDGLSASYGAIRDSFTIIPSDDGQHIILCK